MAAPPLSLPYLPDDILYTIAIHTSYDHMLALLSVRPNNGILLRALYSPWSDFWHRRLGAHTGRGCLVDQSTGLPTKTSLWSFKAQHDAVVPREGNLVLSGRPIHDLEPLAGSNRGIYTNVRAKSVVCRSTCGTGRWSGQSYPHGLTESSIILRYMIITEDGELLYLVREVVTDDDWREHMRTAAEDESAWEVPEFRLAGGDTLSTAPKMKTMVECGAHIVCIDREGRLWLIQGFDSIDQDTSLSVVAIELALPRSIVGDGPVLSVIQTTWVNGIGDLLSHALILALAGVLSEYVLFVDPAESASDTHHNFIIPRFAPIPVDVSALAHTWFRPTIRQTTSKAIAPYAPRLILYSMEGSPYLVRQCVGDRPAELADIEVVDAFRSDPEDVYGYDETYVDIYSRDIIHPREHNDLASITRPFMFNVQSMIAPPDRACAVTADDIKDAISFIEANMPRDAVDLDIEHIIPILPNWIMGRMGMGWDSVMTKWFPSPATTPTDRSNNDPYIWTTIYHDGSTIKVACLMPDGTAYELLDTSDRHKVTVVRDKTTDGDAVEEREVRFLQMGMVHNYIGRAYGIGV